MNDFDLRKYLAENRLLKETKEKDYYNFLMDLGGTELAGHTFQDMMKKRNDFDSFEDFLDDEIDFFKQEGDVKIIDKIKSTFLNENKLLKEFIGGELETRNEPLFSKLVPGQGKAETLEGEMLRAINRIVYRYYNDGDKYYEGYGAETAGPAVSFLVNAVHPLRAKMSRIMDGEELSDNEYENMLKEALGLILDYIEGKEGEYTKNTQGEIFDYESEYEDDDDYYDDYEDDDDYYQE